VTVRRWKNAWWLFINHKGQRRAKRVGDRKAAELAAIKIRARLALGEPLLTEAAPPRALTFKEAAQRWLAAHFQSQQIRLATYDEYSRALRLHVYPRFGAKAVTEVSRADVRDLVVELMSRGKSRSLARNALAPIRQTFNQLIDDGVLTTNPAMRMGRYLKERTDRRARIDFLTPAEERRLLEAALKEFPQHYCLLLCAVRTGLRIG
jgi:integrase